jgi:hypothetical protein
MKINKLSYSIFHHQGTSFAALAKRLNLNERKAIFIQTENPFDNNKLIIETNSQFDT